MTEIIVALIVSLIAPSTLAYFMGRQRRTEKLEDWARQDAVAAKVATVAVRVEQVATDAASAAKDAQEQNAATLKDIHTLVNSDMTAARAAELTATRLLLVALKRLPRTPETDEAIETAQNRVTELDQILADRLMAQRKVEADSALRAVQAVQA